MALYCEPPTNRLDALSAIDDATAVLGLLTELCIGYADAGGMGLSVSGARGLVVIIKTCKKTLHAAAEVLDERQGVDSGDITF
jgi:hypothetical protein